MHRVVFDVAVLVNWWCELVALRARFDALRWVIAVDLRSALCHFIAIPECKTTEDSRTPRDYHLILSAWIVLVARSLRVFHLAHAVPCRDPKRLETLLGHSAHALEISVQQ